MNDHNHVNKKQSRLLTIFMLIQWMADKKQCQDYIIHKLKELSVM